MEIQLRASRAVGVAPTAVAERIAASVAVTPESGCWLWQKATSEAGYGVISIGSRTDGSRKNAYAHRVAYETFVGPIPDGLVLDHLCRTPQCCNPEHLEPVTSRVNTVVRGVGPTAHQSRQTHCKRGHEFTDENTWRDKYSKRYCRTCRALRATR